MAHPRDHAADGRRIGPLDHLVQPAQPQPAQRLAHALGMPDGAPHPADLQPALAARPGRHRHASAAQLAAGAALPRSSATCPASRNCSSALKVALTTLCGFDVPSDFVSTFWIPAASITARTGPPAITPVPSGPGFSSTVADP